MRFVLLVCLVAVVICVYGQSPTRPQRLHQRPKDNESAGDPDERPEPIKPEMTRGDKSRLKTVGQGRTGADSEYTCDFKTKTGCVRCANPFFDGEGVLNQYLRDGFTDCIDGSDEQERYCDFRTDGPECFKCFNPVREGEGVFKKFTCDYRRDCNDGSDEFCPRNCNGANHDKCFKCYQSSFEGEGTYADSLCNNRADCLDRSDEYCFACNDRGYRYCDESSDCSYDVNIEHVCDGVPNCWNNEDENSCFECGDGTKIDADWVCDGFKDCDNNRDETAPACSDGSAGFECGDGTKVDADWVCDGFQDCDNNRDETAPACSDGSAEVLSDKGCEWQEWSDCNVECGAGVKTREKLTSGADQCGGDNIERKACHGEKRCPKEETYGCGTRSTSRGKIVGGTDAVQADWPWQAQLFFQNKFLCGGTLYKNKYVISAAHCFKPGRDLASDWKVHFGKQETHSDSNEHESGVSKLIFNEYNPNTFNNDIVIMVLETPVTLTAGKVNTICLDEQQTKRIQPGSNCFITGFGLTEHEGSVALTLQEVAVPYISREQCSNTKYGKGLINSNMFCAGYADGGVDACQGDSGGPLVCTAPSDDDPYKARWYLAGITSWGIDCARPGYPGVYADVSKYIGWIVQNTP